MFQHNKQGGHLSSDSIVNQHAKKALALPDHFFYGVICCKYDAQLTILDMSDGLLPMLGYTRQEISDRYYNSFSEMIDPQDREGVLFEIRSQLTLQTMLDLEHRVLCKNAPSMWVMNKTQYSSNDEQPAHLNIVLIDFTERKRVEQDKALSLERHRIIMEQTKDIIIEWDMIQNTFTYFNGWNDTYNLQFTSKANGESLTYSSNIHVEDIQAFSEMLDKLRSGQCYAETEFRAKTAEHSYIWFKIRLTTQMDSSGSPVKAVGVIININQEKEQSRLLREKAERDILTKLYNKGTAQALITNCIQRERTHRGAMLIIDIDDFKKINDTMGHLFGDAFLTEISREIQKIFRSSDIVGRIGGDEFIVFLKDIKDEQVVCKKAEMLIKALSEIQKKDNRLGAVSCSIGISNFPSHGTEFVSLYNNADQALYRAKNQGKNQYVIYDKKYECQFIDPLSVDLRTAINETIDFNEDNSGLDLRIVEYVFRILYKSMDLDNAINSILEIIGRQYDVSRAYIFENTEDDRFCCNTFEWCNEGIKSEIDQLCKLSYQEDLDNLYLNNFDMNGIFYCQSIDNLPPLQQAILKPQGVKSLLQCAIMLDGKFKGFVGFDECQTNRFWHREQINALTFISQILSTFLMKKRAEERVQKAAENMRNVLDNQSSWVYVIRPETFELLYINQKTKSLVPEARLGQTCHKAFFNDNVPCSICAVKHMSKQGEPMSLEVYNPILKVWSVVAASEIIWQDEAAVLLTCYDVTAYKEIIQRLEEDKSGCR